MTTFTANLASATQIEAVILPNGRVGYRVGIAGRIYAALDSALRFADALAARIVRTAPKPAPEALKAVETKKLTLRQRAMTCRVKPAVAKVAPVAKVNAIEWIAGILGRFASVATEAQRAMAIALRNEDFISGLMIEPIGPSLSELAARIV
jgi:hypothetical protein